DYRRQRTDHYVLEQRIAEYRTARSRIELTAGVNLDLVGQIRLGWRETKVTQELETGLDVLALQPERSSGGWLLTLDMDQFDRLHFPRSGWGLTASLYDSPRSDYARLAVQATAAWPVGSWVLGTRASWVDSPQGRLPYNDAARLGGFL